MNKTTRSATAWLFLGVALLALDQASKLAARVLLGHGRAVPLVPPLVDLTLVHNRGVALGALADLPARLREPLLLVVPLLITAAVLWAAFRGWRRAASLVRASWVLILAGALGNVIDRFRFGPVTDFMRFSAGGHVLFINNLADDYVCLGVALLLFTLPRGRASSVAASSERVAP
jgi:signal peptidase II